MTKENLTETTNVIDLIPLSQWNKHFNYPSVSTLRHLLFDDNNGFSKVTRRIANRIYIKVSDFNAWVEANGKIA